MAAEQTGERIVIRRTMPNNADPNTEEPRSKSRVGYVVLFVLGVAGHILNIAGVADAIISWRAFFALGLLRAYSLAKHQVFDLIGFDIPAIAQDVIVAATCTIFIFAYALAGSWTALFSLTKSPKSRFHLWSVALYIALFFLGVTAWVFFLGGTPLVPFDDWVERFFMTFYPYVFTLVAPIAMLAVTAQVVKAESGISLHAIPKRLAFAILLVVLGFVGLLFVAADFGGAI